jgi:hypothetical protein
MIKYIFLAFGLLTYNLVVAADFTSKQQAVIYNEAINAIHQYENLLNTLAEQSVDINQANKTGEKLIDLFIARKALVYNDLDPAHQLSEFYELDTYIANLMLWYPDGLKLNIGFDNLKAGNIVVHDENVYTVDILASKKLNGNYINKLKNNNVENLLFRIAFYKEGQNFKSFKIAGIRSTTSKPQNDSRILVEVKGKNIDEKDMLKIKTQVQSVVNDYVNFLNLLADPKEAADDKEFYKTSFLNLFGSDKANLVNDIEPKPAKRWLNTNEYIQNYMQAFPEGIRNLGVNVDSAKFGKVIPGDKDKFSISVSADKFFSGKYKDKTILRDNSKLDIKISFERDENTYKNFRFESIDKPEMNLNDQATTSENAELPNLTISSLKRNGYYMGAGVSYDFVSCNNPNLTQDDVLKWKLSSAGSITPSLVVRYYPSNQIGIETGLTLDKYNCDMKLNGNYTSKISKYDAAFDHNYYQQLFASNYDSVVNYSYLRIPLMVVYHSNKEPEKFGFYAKVGLSFSLLLSSKYTTTADSVKNPRIFDNDPQGILTDLNDDGSKRTYKSMIHNTGNVAAGGLNVSLIASAGVTIPIGYYSSLEAGPEIVYGISDIYTKSSYVNMLDNSSSAKKMNFFKLGFRVGFNYKF